jgi:NmrA-like family
MLTRNQTKATELKKMGFDAVVANLDGTDNNKSLNDAIAGCVGCYIHATSSDTKDLDKNEVDCASTLCNVLLVNNVRIIVLNSAAGEKEHGVRRIQQKHDVEKLFLAHADILFTSLRANLFMDEFWKKYTRPSILAGKFPFSVPSDRSIYLTSVRDMGRLAGTIIMKQQQKLSLSTINHHCIVNVASDVLTPNKIAKAFATEQGSPCIHKKNHIFALIVRFFFRDLYEIIRFYRKSTETTDIDNLKQEFPSLLTSFSTFLSESNWSNRELTFESLQEMQALQTDPK